jgi:tetratricopeptide (TPR) repeat protein
MRFHWACLSCIAFAVPAQAADELAFGPAPSWVAVQSLPALPSAESDVPISFLLFDSQAKLEPDEVASYSHSAFRINNPQGLPAANVMASWNPAFDSVTVHRVVIRRGDQLIDVLAKGQKFTILRREQNLEQQTLNGQLTATLQPEGLQVGDIIEVETTVVHRDPTLRGHMEMTGGFSSPMRIERAEIRIIAPAKAPIREHNFGGLGAPSVSLKEGQKFSTWVAAPLVPDPAPEFAPPRYSRGKMVDLTDFQSWNDLAALFLPLFKQASAIPADSPVQQEISRIKAASPDPVRRAELALQLVEEKVRYVNLALGTGGLVPASADETWKRRFGDCKAKTALLVGLLRELGIDAAPVLVHSEAGDGLNERLPMVALFDHAIVRANIGGKTYWLDGTRTGDSELGTLAVPFYHWGLPIIPNAELVKIVPGPRDQPDIETIIHTDASAGVGKPVPTTIDLVMRGDLAILLNQLMSSLDQSLRDEAIRKRLQNSLDRFEIDKVTSNYDKATQVYRLHGEGRETLDLNKGIYWTEVPSLGYEADFRRSGKRDLDAPVQMTYPSYTRDIQVIVIPKDLVSRTKFQVAPVVTTVAGVEYRRNFKNENGIITIETTRRAMVPEISFAEAVAAQDRLRELNGDDIGIRLSSSAPIATDEVKQLIGHEPKTSDDYMHAAMKLLQDGEPAKGLGALDEAVELAPGKSEPRSFRAGMRLGAGDVAGAEADALAALKIDPKSVSSRRVLAEVYRQKEDFDAAYAQAKFLEKVDNASAQVQLGQLLLSLDRTQEALAAFDRALTFEKDPMTHVFRAGALPAADKQARMKELEAALKLNPSDAPALAGLADIASQLGDHARALQLLDQAFLKSPDDVRIRNQRAVEMMLAGKTEAANREFDALAAKDLTADQLNSMCWAKALANAALDRALDECNRSLAKDDSGATHDSKAVVLLRQSRFDEAIKEFDIALNNGERPASLYGRALAYAGKGDKTKALAEAARAKKLSPGIDRFYSYYGLVQ